MILKKEVLKKLKLKENNGLSLDLCKILNCQQKSLFLRIDKATDNFRTNAIVQSFIKTHFPNEKIFE